MPVSFRTTLFALTLGALSLNTLNPGVAQTATPAKPAKPVLTKPAPSSPLRLVLSQDLVQTVQVEGKTEERFTPAPKGVRPGDALREVLAVSNVGGKLLRGVAVRLPVPQGTVYTGGASVGAGYLTEYSFDGGKTFGAAPLKRKVTVTENGQSVTREVVVPPAEYTTVRWTMQTLSTDQALNFSFRVQVK